MGAGAETDWRGRCAQGAGRSAQGGRWAGCGSKGRCKGQVGGRLQAEGARCQRAEEQAATLWTSRKAALTQHQSRGSHSDGNRLVGGKAFVVAGFGCSFPTHGRGGGGRRAATAKTSLGSDRRRGQRRHRCKEGTRRLLPAGAKPTRDRRHPRGGRGQWRQAALQEAQGPGARRRLGEPDLPGQGAGEATLSCPGAMRFPQSRPTPRDVAGVSHCNSGAPCWCASAQLASVAARVQ
mmetsp:Transcript_10789/g.34196  ORF Transcript_10789/g.34196 Transcript_10789/m.34196 type:complete len:236 (+) Transcript_10789:90-797(+)